MKTIIRTTAATAAHSATAYLFHANGRPVTLRGTRVFAVGATPEQAESNLRRVFGSLIK